MTNPTQTLIRLALNKGLALSGAVTVTFKPQTSRASSNLVVKLDRAHDLVSTKQLGGIVSHAYLDAEKDYRSTTLGLYPDIRIIWAGTRGTNWEDGAAAVMEIAAEVRALGLAERSEIAAFARVSPWSISIRVDKPHTRVL